MLSIALRDPKNLKNIINVSCSHRLSVHHVFETIEIGSLLVGCLDASIHYAPGGLGVISCIEKNHFKLSYL